MKAYIGNVDWADEGDVFFFSVESEGTLKLMKELIEIIAELDLLPFEVEMYWGTNEQFYFDKDDLINFIDEAEDITNDELEVLKKFGISGFNIYDRIINLIYDCINPWDRIPEISEEGLAKIKPLFVELFGQRSWDKLKINIS